MESSPQSHRYISLDNVQMSDLMATVQGNVASGLCGFKSVETVAYLPSQKPKDLTPTDTLGWQIVTGAIPLLYFGNFCCMGLDGRAGREHGVVIQQVQLNCGDVFLELNEQLLLGESGLVGAQKSSCIPTSTTAFSSNNVPVYENQPAPTCSHDQEGNADCIRAIKLPEKVCLDIRQFCVQIDGAYLSSPLLPDFSGDNTFCSIYKSVLKNRNETNSLQIRAGSYTGC